ncbi:unnamed protein product, partial [Allacma fusca]
MQSNLQFIFLNIIGLSVFLHGVHSQDSETPNFYKPYVQHKRFEIDKPGQESVVHREELLLSSRLKQETIFSQFFPNEFKLNDDFYKLLFKNLTVECADQFEHYLDAISALPKIPDTWVLQMLDAWGKLPSGILSGNLGMFGDFYECVGIKGKYESKIAGSEVQVKGKYCNTLVLPGPEIMKLIGSGTEESVLETLDLGIRNSASLEELILHFLNNGWPQILPMMGTCFPAVCSNQDVQEILTSFHTHKLKDLMTQVVVDCRTDEKPPLGGGEYAMIVVLSLIALVCISGTCIDVYGTAALKQRPGMNVILAFSVYTNTKRWLNMSVGTENLGCFHGLKFFSMLWILQGHTFVTAVSLLVWNNWDVKTIHEDWSVYPIINGFNSVDTFFVLSGILVCYNLMKELDKQEGRFNYILFVVHRYLR